MHTGQDHFTAPHLLVWLGYLKKTTIFHTKGHAAPQGSHQSRHKTCLNTK